MAKILITGATGFIGKALVPALISAGHEVRCAVSRKVSWINSEQILVKRLECAPDWSNALSGIDVVIHLAAKVHVMKEKSKSALEDYWKINSIATKNLATEAVRHQVKRFIFLSSIKVNGEFTVSGIPFTEKSVPQPEDPYGHSKLCAEHYLQEISQNTGMEIVIIRPPLVYGPEVKANFLKMLHLLKKEFPLPFGKVENSRHFVYLGNLVSALCRVVTHPEAANQTYLVADDDPLSLARLMRLMGNEMKVKVRLVPVPVRFMKIIFGLFGLNRLNVRLFASLEVSNLKIKNQLGWVPPVSSTEGVRKTVKWYQCGFGS